MRRKDREVTDEKRILEIMEKCDCCRVAFNTDDVPYVVPMNFGLAENGKVLYFHSAMAGRKYELAQKSQNVAFEMDCNHALDKTEKAVDCGYFYSSVMGKGKISLVTDVTEKTTALNALMKHYYHEEKTWDYGNMIDHTAIIKVEIMEITCKERR